MIEKPDEVQKSYWIPKWVIEGLNEIIKRKGGTQVGHVRQALIEYIAGLLGTAYVKRKMKEAEKK